MDSSVLIKLIKDKGLKCVSSQSTRFSSLCWPKIAHSLRKARNNFTRVDFRSDFCALEVTSDQIIQEKSKHWSGPPRPKRPPMRPPKTTVASDRQRLQWPLIKLKKDNCPYICAQPPISSPFDFFLRAHSVRLISVSLKVTSDEEPNVGDKTLELQLMTNALIGSKQLPLLGS